MFTVYVYVLDTMADWELGFITAELNTGRFFRKDAPGVLVKTVGVSRKPVRTMGGLTVIPDCAVDDIAVNEKCVLLLPGANTWDDDSHDAIVRKAETILLRGGTVCAICGATVRLANAGLLDHRQHTSNGVGFLDITAPGYRGRELYVDEPSTADRGLITAGAAGALSWAKQILERLEVFWTDTLEAWYAYFRTGDAMYFHALMETLADNI